MAKQLDRLTILRGNGRLESVKATTYTGSTSFDAFSASMARAIGADDSGLALAYAASVWSYRCVNIRATKFSSVPFAVYDKRTGKPIPEHPLMEAISDAYTWRNRDLMFDIEAALCIWGELYLEKMVNMFNMPSGLKWINPLVIEPYIINGAIQYFFITDMFSNRSYQLPPSAVAYYRLFNPMDDNRGLSPMTVALDALNIDRSIQKSAKAWFENDSRPDYIVSPKQGDGWGQDVLDRITDWWRTNLKGQKNRGKGAIIDMPIDYNQLQREPVPTQVDLSNSQAEKVCAPFGVSPAAAGRWDNMPYDNAEEQDLFLYEQTIEPEATIVDKWITNQVLPFFDQSGYSEFKHDFNAVMAKAASNQKRVQVVSQKYRDGVITLNEYRKQTGDAALPGGDVFLIPQGSVVVPVEQLTQMAQLVNIAPPPTEQLPSSSMPQVTATIDGGANADVIPAQVMEPSKAADELLKWERASTKSGKNKAMRFVADNVPSHIQQYIKTALQGADFDNKQAIRGVFTKATAMLNIGEDAIETITLNTINHAPDITADEVTVARAYLEQIGAIDSEVNGGTTN